MEKDESVVFFRRFAPTVLNALLATGCVLYVFLMYGALQSIDGGDTGTAIGLLALAIVVVGALAVAFSVFSVCYYWLASRRLDRPHRGLDLGTVSALAVVPAVAILASSEEIGLLVGGLALLGEVVGILAALLDP